MSHAPEQLTEAERAERVTFEFQRKEILDTLRRRGALTPAQLVDKTGLTLAVVVVVLLALLRKGEVEDAGDGTLRFVARRSRTARQGARA